MVPPVENASIRLPDRMISRAIGEELRRTREALGWSRLQLATRLPSGIGERTLLAYEHGRRNLTALRLVEIGHAMAADPPKLLSRGLQRARIRLENLALEIDLRALLCDQNEVFRPLHQWARNALKECSEGIAYVDPEVVRNLALFVGCPYLDLANYLSKFTSEN